MKNLYFLLCFGLLSSCNTIDLYEKTKAFAKQEWKASESPTFTFAIEDTLLPYNIFVVFRHTDAYSFNNLWLNITTTQPGGTTTSQQVDLKLADNQKGWLGSGMDDIFEHRIKVTQQPTPLKKGTYTFKVQHIMREEPLRHVLNAGIRVEKVRM